MQFDSVYDDRKGKTKASNVTGGSGGTRDFGAPTSRHHLGKNSINLFAGRAIIMIFIFVARERKTQHRA